KKGRIMESINLLSPLFIPKEEEESGWRIGRLLVELYLHEGRHKEAEDIYLSLAVAQPNNPLILAEYGIFLRNSGE
ncbi:hypothetical protein SK128_026209, partial [Halocaridina rubra]